MLGQLSFGHDFHIGSDMCVTVWGDPVVNVLAWDG